MVGNDFKKAKQILDVYNKFGQIGIWYCDKLQNEEEVSEEWAAMIGYRADEINPMSDQRFMEFIHPEDIKLTLKKAESFYKGEVNEYSNEFRMKHKEGHYVWVISKAQIYSWEGDRPKLIIGTHINIDEQKKALEKIVRQNHAIVSIFSKVVEFKDSYTKNHMDMVGDLAYKIGYRLGLELPQLENLWVSGKLHDLGKLDTPIEILNKPGKLTAMEYSEAKRHVEVSYELLNTLDFGFPLADIVGQHHERLDGSGYPDGLKGEEIHYLSQVIAVADVADAMLSDRPYRNKISQELVIDILSSYRGCYYYEEIIDACIDVIKSSNIYSAQ